MKRFSLSMLILVFCAVTVLQTSCSKPKGCTDATSLNFDADAEKDDGSCIYPADKLVGTWNVAETVAGTTVNHTATITRKDNDNIIISMDWSTQEVYHADDLEVQVLWTEMLIDRAGTTIGGNITNENDFTIDYLYGTSTTVYSVVQHYTR